MGSSTSWGGRRIKWKERAGWGLACMHASMHALIRCSLFLTVTSAAPSSCCFDLSSAMDGQLNLWTQNLLVLWGYPNIQKWTKTGLEEAFWRLDKIQPSSGTYETDSHLPEGVTSLTFGRRDLWLYWNRFWHLSANQRPCWPPGSLSITSTCYLFQNPRCHPSHAHLLLLHPKLRPDHGLPHPSSSFCI